MGTASINMKLIKLMIITNLMIFMVLRKFWTKSGQLLSLEMIIMEITVFLLPKNGSMMHYLIDQNQNPTKDDGTKIWLFIIHPFHFMIWLLDWMNFLIRPGFQSILGINQLINDSF